MFDNGGPPEEDREDTEEGLRSLSVRSRTTFIRATASCEDSPGAPAGCDERRACLPRRRVDLSAPVSVGVDEDDPGEAVDTERAE